MTDSFITKISVIVWFMPSKIRLIKANFYAALSLTLYGKNEFCAYTLMRAVRVLVVQRSALIVARSFALTNVGHFLMFLYTYVCGICHTLASACLLYFICRKSRLKHLLCCKSKDLLCFSVLGLCAVYVCVTLFFQIWLI